MTYYLEHGFATNDVAGAIAAALLHDLNVNGFVFTGFPAVLVTSTGDSFEIRLALSDMTAGPLTIPFQTGKAFAKSFQKRKQIDSAWIRKLQDLVVEIERQSSVKDHAMGGAGRGAV